jgi:5,5'-dehydrodivanillate O-demethylase oxygenase subunit
VHHPGVDFPVEGPNDCCDYELPWINEKGKIRTDYVEGQDLMAWVTQGLITNRSVEHIGKSDLGAVKVRRLFKDNLARVADGQDPMGVVRFEHDRIDLPCEKNKFGAGPDFAIQWLNMGSHQFSPQIERLLQIHRDSHRKVG